ncbi:MAG: cation acetate symporter [Desulfomonile tiedjei]|uniref:Cation acetate symporter n=1 Tax=Desulfomonile tiedjei TaxID=2358 RepID=A0A9D6Z378_9BACT|nr:cation acetate symporter [Desulfomonile tiedjei]
MSAVAWTYLVTVAIFGLYVVISWRSVSLERKGFYVAGVEKPPILNGMATAADWISAGSFMSIAGLVAFTGYSGSVYIMGWTGGYVLLAILLAPYLRKLGRFTVPEFVGDRYYSNSARAAALFCAILISFVYVCAQMRGVGIILARLLSVEIHTAVIIGSGVIFIYAVFGGMKGIVWTQVTQYIIMILAYLIPACLIATEITGIPVPQAALGGTIAHGKDSGQFLLDALDKMNGDLGFAAFTSAFGPGGDSRLNMLCITVALMFGTAGLPHILVKFYTVPSVQAARLTAAYALLFVALLYLTVPAVAAFARYNLISSVNGKAYNQVSEWFREWEKTGLVVWVDKNGDGIIQFSHGNALEETRRLNAEQDQSVTRIPENAPAASKNELYVDPDITILMSPEIAGLPGWVLGLLVAGALTAALSTSAGLLLVIGSALAHDFYYRMINPKATAKRQLLLGRGIVAVTVILACYVGVYPPAYVAQVVAFAFGLAASSFFPIILMGIFWKRTTSQGAIAGMLAGISFSGLYIIQVGFFHCAPWFLGISAEGIGAIGMLVNFAVTYTVSMLTPPPPQEIQDTIENVRNPVSVS